MRILIVDDNAGIREMLTESLTNRGHVCEAVNGGRAAFDILRVAADAVDAIISDLEMPGGGGLELFEQVESGFPHLSSRFVFMTGAASWLVDQVAHETKRPVLTKPFSTEELLRLLGALTGGEDASLSRESA